MPRDATLNDALSDMVMGVKPTDLTPREAAELADKLTYDEGAQERVLAGDRTLERFIGDLAARADGLDPGKPDPFATHPGQPGVDRHVHRNLVRAAWEQEDEKQHEADEAARFKQEQGRVDALNKRRQSLTALGWDDAVAFRVAQQGDAETVRCQGLDPAAYERGFELPRGQGDKR